MKKILIIFVIVFILGSVNYLNENNIKSFLLGLVSDFSLFFTEKIFEVKIFWFSITRYSSITEENVVLLSQNAALLSEKHALLSIKDENEQLKKQFSVSSKKNYVLEQVRIFLNLADFSGNFILIDKGKDFGILDGQAVIYGGNVLIGVVKEVYDFNAGVVVVGDSRLEISAKTLSGDIVLAKGSKIGEEIILDFARLDNEVAEGEPIFTNGADNVPENLLIGYVKKVETDSGGLFKTILVKPAYKEFNSINAFVLK